MGNPHLIHILSDFRPDSVESTMARALLYSHFPDTPNIISAPNLPPGYNVPAAIFLQMVLDSFPKDTLHICHLSIPPELPPRYLLARYQDQWFMAPDTGFLPIIFGETEVEYLEINYPKPMRHALKDVFLPAALVLAEHGPDHEHFRTWVAYRRGALLAPTIQQNAMRLTVIYTDPKGNAILNLKEAEFEKHRNGRRFRLFWPVFRRDITRICHHPGELPPTELGAWFGPGGLLQLFMNGGSAGQYYGLNESKTILLEFLDN